MCKSSSILFFILVLVGNASPASSQDFLKQLEEKLKLSKPDQPAGQQSQPPSGDDSEALPPPNSGIADNPFLLPGESPMNSKIDKRPPPPPVRKPEAAAPAPPTRQPQNDSGKRGTGEGYLGVVAERSPGGGLGLVVVKIAEYSPAYKAGMQVGDRILAVAGHAVSDLDDFAEQLGLQRVGVPVKFLIHRGGKNIDVTAVLIDRGLAARIQSGDAAFDFPVENGSGVPAALGVTVVDLSESFRRTFSIGAFRGAAIESVTKGSPAEGGGLMPGDCIVEVNGLKIVSAEQMRQWVANARPGEVANISYYRGRAFLTTAIVLGPSHGEIASGGLPYQSNRQSDWEERFSNELERVRSQLRETQEQVRSLEDRLRRLEQVRR